MQRLFVGNVFLVEFMQSIEYQITDQQQIAWMIKTLPQILRIHMHK